MAREFFTIPGRVATLASCWTAPASRVFPNDSERKNLPGTRIPAIYPTGTSHSFTPICLTPSSILELHFTLVSDIKYDVKHISIRIMRDRESRVGDPFHFRTSR